MKISISFLGIAAGLTMAVSLTNTAQAATVSTSGVWTSLSGNPTAGPFDLGTSTVRWGIPGESQSSAYKFEGVTGLNMPLDGNNFLLGTFIHDNFIIRLPSITEAKLALKLDVTNGANFSQVFNFTFKHNETLNDGVNGVCPDTPGYATPCPDIVSIPNATSVETLNINGEAYKLFISGFQQGGQLVNQFITAENRSNSAQLFAKLQKVPQPKSIPEPVTGIGASVAVGLFWLTKRKQSKVK
jgi:hypothetical protein